MSFNLFDPFYVLAGQNFKKTFDDHGMPNPKNTSDWGLGIKPNLDNALYNCSKLEWRVKVLKENSKKIKQRLLFGSIFIVLSAILMLFITPFFMVLGAVYYSILVVGLKKIKKDVVKYEVAKKKGWLYDPQQDISQGDALSKKFPKFFKRASEHYVDDQMWGIYDHNGVKQSFYSGLYTYVTVTHTKNGTQKHYYPNNFFAIKLDKKIPQSFSLHQENLFSRFGQKFTNKEIEVESIKFNKEFEFAYEGSKSSAQIEIVKLLSPFVQLKLLDLNKQGRGLRVLFKDDFLVFMFKGNLLKRVKSKIVFGLKIHEDDIHAYDNYLNTFNEIANEIVAKI